jgi:hypothetical protein
VNKAVGDRNVMLRIDARQGAPKEGQSPLELFEVLKSFLTSHIFFSISQMTQQFFFI